MSDLIHLQIDPKTSHRQALEQASCILGDLLYGLIEGTALTGDGYFSLALLSDQAKAFVDAALSAQAKEGQA
ncbi:TPA: hypothetical protein ACKPYC_002072 [Pseudomonas aeruginosa]|uniref:hypothetical protein n=1 Tax=Pseudomonas TaxID=286 RepID=UPI00053D3A69|nr:MULTISPECIES: hypothetical protein [Pseudomonas]AYW43004.1 hypothetical protein DL351_27675 [Pseudomonas aeruginosa]KSC10261.1 hypothetical protein AO886_29625 [Pseudomonas aeruginosa]KSG17144.1 hypothetical protein AO946_31665 [Pseudomonas aeruginosa]MBA5620385.1 hypothetical protein [Pseudomonas aeruginosa]MBG5429752.1 hypothetical protein [Pseudomonas aeruginosa]